jgi:hypothetical protein
MQKDKSTTIQALRQPVSSTSSIETMGLHHDGLHN